MVGFVKETIGGKLAELKGDELAAYRQKIEDVALALTAEANQPVGKMADFDKRVAAGRDAIVNEFACIDCHKFRDEGAARRRAGSDRLCVARVAHGIHCKPGR